jgi:hypothetical protein
LCRAYPVWRLRDFPPGAAHGKKNEEPSLGRKALQRTGVNGGFIPVLALKREK